MNGPLSRSEAFQITLPQREEAFTVTSFTGHEVAGELYRLIVHVTAADGDETLANALLQSQASLFLLADGAAVRAIHGIVARVQSHGAMLGGRQAHSLTILLAEEGLLYYFEHPLAPSDGQGETLVVADVPRDFSPMDGDATLHFQRDSGSQVHEDMVTWFASQTRTRSTRAMVRGFDFQRPDIPLGDDAAASEGASGLDVIYEHEGSYEEDLAAKSAKKFDHYPFAFPFGLAGSTTALTQDGVLTHAVAQDLTTGALTWSGVIDRFQNVSQSGRRLLALLPEDILAVDLVGGSIVRYAIPSPPPKRDAPQRTHAALSDDGAFLITGIAGETTIFDVRVPAAPKVITTFPVQLLDASFSPGSSVARLFIDAQVPGRAYDAAQRKELPFVAGDIGPPPVPRDSIAALGELEPNLSGSVCAFDEATSTVAICNKDYLALARPVNGRFEAVRLTFSFGRMGGMAMDEHGYYDFFGDVPPSFRASASCGGERPIEVCSDRFEAPGLLQKFLRGDL